MLAALLLARERVLSDAQLGEMLWGKNPPKTYQAQIYTYVSRLRQHLPGSIQVVRQGFGYSLRIGPAHFDFREFERLSREGRAALQATRYSTAAELFRSALNLWRGPTLTDVTELLGEAERPAIEEDRMEALENRIDAELILGRHERLTSELVGLVAAHPLRERIRAQAMVALYRSDRQGEAFATYHDGCDLLANELGVDPGPALRSTYQAILTDDVERLYPDPAGPSIVVSTRMPAPAMLDPDIPDFVDRTQQLAALAEALRPAPATAPHQPPPVVVTGMGGVGKTSLVVHAAHIHRSEFPDGQIFVDLRGSHESPLTPTDALVKVLGVFGFDTGTLPSGVDQLVQLYRGTLANRKVLVVLDDAASDEQVRPLLLGDPRCRVLVTTRFPLTTLMGQRTINLQPMAPADGLALLTRIVGPARVAAERAAAERIVARCAGLPLAIRVAGARLDAKRHWSLGRLADQLEKADCLDGLSMGQLDVRERLSRTFRLLDDRPRAALLRLSLINTQSFPHSTTSALLGVSDDVGEYVTEHLLDLHLLDHSGIDAAGRHRYRFHGLVRLVARELAAAEGVTLGDALPLLEQRNPRPYVFSR